MPLDENTPGTHQFSRAGVHDHAPAESGVYVIHGLKSCLYVGESQNIRLRLLEHLADTNGCIMRHMPFTFAFELAQDGVRVERQKEFILEFRPLCNPLSG